MRFIVIVLFSVAGTFAFSVQGQIFSKKVNRLDESGKRTGKWITYWDEEEKIPMSYATYKDGREHGVSKEYHNNGRLRLKFRYRKDRIRVKYYTRERKLEQKGWSRLEYNAEDTHYYWHGKWKFYDTTRRKIIRVSHYEFGEEVAPPGTSGSVSTGTTE
jgi:antitoxin component YwqK of YwqJK toxin-antitoxin module